MDFETVPYVWYIEIHECISELIPDDIEIDVYC